MSASVAAAVIGLVVEDKRKRESRRTIDGQVAERLHMYLLAAGH
jgi:hypothetical protein